MSMYMEASWCTDQFRQYVTSFFPEWHQWYTENHFGVKPTLFEVYTGATPIGCTALSVFFYSMIPTIFHNTIISNYLYISHYVELSKTLVNHDNLKKSFVNLLS